MMGKGNSASAAMKKALLGRGFPVDIVRVKEADGGVVFSVVLSDGADRRTARLVHDAVAAYLRDHDLTGGCDVLVPT
jgi:hypothetical protein